MVETVVSNGTKTRTSPTSVDERLARVEEGYDQLRGEVHTLSEVIRAQGRDLSAAIREVNDKISTSGKANWGLYFSGLGVLLAFGVTIGGGALAPLYLMASSNKADLASATVLTRNRMDDKFDAINRLREEEMKNLDTVLQREMRLLNDSQDTDSQHMKEQVLLLRDNIASVDKRLYDHEMLPGHPTAIQRHEETTARFDQIDADLLRRIDQLDMKLQQEMVLADKAQAERIKALDEKLQHEVKAVRDLLDYGERTNTVDMLLETLKGAK